MGIRRVSDPAQLVGTLSGGERQALAIARALYLGAKVLILDEPTAALGVKESRSVIDPIRKARDQGMPIILITHNMPVMHSRDFGPDSYPPAWATALRRPNQANFDVGRGCNDDRRQRGAGRKQLKTRERPMENDTRRMANAIRALSMDAIQRANSGHPGMPLGMAEIAVAVWRRHLRHNPNNPGWVNRDRFVLSNGHGSMLQYALLHLSGYDLTIEDIKNFRKLHSKTPGHPELGDDARCGNDNRAVGAGDRQCRRHGHCGKSVGCRF